MQLWARRGAPGRGNACALQRGERGPGAREGVSRFSSAMLAWLVTCMLLLRSAAASGEPLTLYVHPVLGDDGAPSAGWTPGTPLKSLAETQRRLRGVLREQPGRDLVVELLPGSHRVPPGGLVITAEDSTSTVIWRGASNGSTSVTGGEAVTGWTATTDPSLPKGTMAAPCSDSSANVRRGPKLPEDPYATGKRTIDVALPSGALAIIANAGPRQH